MRVPPGCASAVARLAARACEADRLSRILGSTGAVNGRDLVCALMLRRAVA
jgi:hypothetical protein